MHNFNQDLPAPTGSARTLLHTHTHVHHGIRTAYTSWHIPTSQSRMLVDWEGSLHFMRRDVAGGNANSNSNNNMPGYARLWVRIFGQDEMVVLSGGALCVVWVVCAFLLPALFAIIACASRGPKSYSSKGDGVTTRGYRLPNPSQPKRPQHNLLTRAENPLGTRRPMRTNTR